LRQAQSEAQDQIVTLAAEDYDTAAAALKTRETPAWRKLREAVLQQLKAARDAASIAAATRASAQRMQLCGRVCWPCWPWSSRRCSG
jgi:methyl-accepting chemotaxis protein